MPHGFFWLWYSSALSSTEKSFLGPEMLQKNRQLRVLFVTFLGLRPQMDDLKWWQILQSDQTSASVSQSDPVIFKYCHSLMFARCQSLPFSPDYELLVFHRVGSHRAEPAFPEAGNIEKDWERSTLIKLMPYILGKIYQFSASFCDSRQCQNFPVGTQRHIGLMSVSSS